MTEEELPSEWAWVTLGEITDSPPAKVTSAERPELPFIGMDSIEPGSLGLSKVGRFAEMRSAASYFRPNDILYGRLRPYLNKVHRAHFEGAASAEFIVMPPSEAVVPEFLMYLLHSHAFVRFASSKTSGDRPRVDRNDVIQYRLGLPPAKEQRRIVERIDELFSQIEAGEAALVRAKRLLERYRQAVLKAAVTGELTKDWRERHKADLEPADHLLARILHARREAWEKAELEKLRAKGKEPESDKWKQKYKAPEPPDTTDLPELPEGWVWAKLEAVTSWGPQNGLYLPKSAYGTGTPILRINDYQPGWSRPSEDLLLVDADTEIILQYGLRVGDIIVNRVNSLSHLGKSLVVDERHDGALFESNMMRLRPTQFVLGKFIDLYLRSEFGLKALTRNAKWAVNQASINQGDVTDTPIPVPTLSEQVAIIDGAEFALSECESTIDQLKREMMRAAALRQAILTAAFAGKLVPQDPADEPAKALLDRIRAERTQPASRRRRKAVEEAKRMVAE